MPQAGPRYNCIGMDHDDLTRRIDRLHGVEQPSLLRLDEGHPFSSRLAVLPSAFNPPTLAHLELLRAAAASPGVGSVAAMLTTRNVAKGLVGASLAHRARMLLELGYRDVGLPVLITNQSRIADQARLLADDTADVEIDVIVGYDTLIRVFDEQYYTSMADELELFFRAHRLIAANRANDGLPEIAKFLERPEVAPFAGRIVACAIAEHAVDVSSTAARDAVASGREATDLAPEIREYIREHGLYRRDRG